ncbi:MAG: DUF2062 domain-containing protein [Alphaproteobacteria bacterium]|nr:DUF2062 domain-containing protein [Alphaproteobacteria bacterium]
MAQDTETKKKRLAIRRRNAAAKRLSLRTRVRRLLRYRLIVPIRRSYHAPPFAARGVAIGLFWGMAPFVGLQIVLVLATWFVLRAAPRLNFSLVLGIAWTWISNAFTTIPMLYVYYVTGQIMFGHWDRISGYDAFTELVNPIVEARLSEIWTVFYEIAVKELGVSILTGSVPYMVVCAWGGYWLALRIARRYRERRLAKLKERNDALAAGSVPVTPI